MLTHCPRLKALHVKGCRSIEGTFVTLLENFLPELLFMDVSFTDFTFEHYQTLRSFTNRRNLVVLNEGTPSLKGLLHEELGMEEVERHIGLFYHTINGLQAHEIKEMLFACDLIGANASSTSLLRNLLLDGPYMESGFSSVLLACFLGHQPTVRLLLDLGADIDARAIGGLSCLHLTCRRPNCESLMFELLQRGANVHARSKKGFTPLHNAAYESNVTVAKLLIQYGMFNI
jgi:hypothetical protein